MLTLDIPITLLHANAKVPSKKEHDLCYDISCVADDNFINYGSGACYNLAPGEAHIFSTGIAMKIPSGYALQLWDRSGMGAKKNIHCLAGVIDSSYVGEILVCLINLSEEYQRPYEGDRIVQGHLVEQIDADFTIVDQLEQTERGSKGFGSSGA